MIILTDSEDELFTQIPKEGDTLLRAPGGQNGVKKKEKLTGKTWRCVKSVFTRRNYPCSILLILGTEFCERFSYYGMGAILILYLTKWLKFEADSATAIFHAFAMLCYFSPMIGAVLADGFIGKYRTILYPSIVYVVGNLIMSVTAIPPPEWIGPMIGLLLIAFGTGGIKPCVGAFGADQFGPGQEKERDSFFSAFYFMINLGSLLSTLLTPVLRADVKCYGGNCYPLAFGVPAILMLVSVVLFVSGRKMYVKNPPSGNLFGRVAKCIYLGICGKLSGKRKNRGHWLDYASLQFEQEFIEEVKDVLKILAMFIPLPVFWALAHQQGSRWTLQAEQMDGNVGIFGTLKPDQMQALNPLLIILLIPVFEKFIYPACDKYKCMNRPLQRMVTGLFLSSLSFVLAALVQIELEKQKDTALSIGQSGLTIVNSIPCSVYIKSSFYNQTLHSYQDSGYMRIKPGTHSVEVSSSNCITKSSMSYQFTNQKSYRLFISSNNKTLIFYKAEDERNKPMEGQSYLSIFSNIDLNGMKLKLVTNGYHQPIKSNTGINFNLYYNYATNFTSVDPGRYDMYYKEANSSTWKTVNQDLTIGFGAVYTCLVFKENSTKNEISTKLFTSVAENSMSMIWLVPQYVVITVGEILFSITGLSLAYSQAPKSMKTVVQAAWLMTSAVGDLIVVIVAEGRFIPSQIGEFFFFAALMAVDSFVFMIMSYFYTYQDCSSVIESESSDYEDTTRLIYNTRENDHLPLQEINSENHLRNRT